ncbi:aminoglycoside phosphotransferase family protein [Candidatus Pacearchaeota archaeon]|nr:MAG: aminoglycoside phosphotransferase family protein [Candidatus Pacearchaeota archaeon]
MNSEKRSLEGCLEQLEHARVQPIPGNFRNFIGVAEVGGRRYVVKKYMSEECALREEFFYNIFGEVISVPEILGKNGLTAYFAYVESSKKKDVPRAIFDWAKVHSTYLDSPLCEHPLAAQHRSRNIVEFVQSNPQLFGKRAQDIIKRIQTGPTKHLRCLIHGDLHTRNILSTSSGNFYIDFEFAGATHPARDLALLVLTIREHMREIIDAYSHAVSFRYPSLKDDIIREALIKGVQLVANVHKVRGSLQDKISLREKFALSMEMLLDV